MLPPSESVTLTQPKPARSKDFSDYPFIEHPALAAVSLYNGARTTNFRQFTPPPIPRISSQQHSLPRRVSHGVRFSRKRTYNVFRYFPMRYNCHTSCADSARIRRRDTFNFHFSLRVFLK